jgi:type 1 fimbria pilin
MITGQHLCHSVLLTLLATLSLSAVAAVHNGNEVGGTSGWLHIQGVMQEPACRVAMASSWQHVSLQPLSTDTLKRPGDSAEPTTFYIRLEGCLRSAGTVADSQNNTVVWSEWQPIATLTFSGVADSTVPSLFKANGVKGIGLRLRNAAGHVLLPGVKSQPQFLTPGDDVLYFSLAAERTSASLQAGNYNATLDFQIHYQ